MARVATSQIEIINAVLARVRVELGLNERTCYLAIDPLDPPMIPKGGPFCVVLGVGDGAFPQEMQIGGGDDQCTETWHLVVAIFSRLKTDQVDHARYILRDAERGLLRIKWMILRCLIGMDPVTSIGNTCLRQTLYAVSCGRPMVLRSRLQPGGLACMPLEFGVEFDWDLTGGSP